MFKYDWFYFPDVLNYDGTINPSKYVDWLNEMQTDGWELVQTLNDGGLDIGVFKRKVVPDGQDRLL